jgi:hypothetical protein
MAVKKKGGRSRWQEQMAGGRWQVAGADGRWQEQQEAGDFPYLIFHTSFFID